MSQNPLFLRTGPRVVGTILTREFLESCRNQPQFSCDLIELRLDGFPESPNWLETGQILEAAGYPVFMTLRLQSEGGRWTGPDPDRMPFFEQAIAGLSGIDIEIDSPLAEEVGRRARRSAKAAIVSYHNFHETPPLQALTGIIEKGRQLGNIVKIAAKVNSLEDVATLRCVLEGKWDIPLCIIGMGALGRETRVRFPLEGSCFTYGYLDIPGAPGQMSAGDLKTQLRSLASF
jgi:3-dehydroquinate dehydratase-1